MAAELGVVGDLEQAAAVNLVRPEGERNPFPGIGNVSWMWSGSQLDVAAENHPQEVVE